MIRPVRFNRDKPAKSTRPKVDLPGRKRARVSLAELAKVCGFGREDLEGEILSRMDSASMGLTVNPQRMA